MEPNNYNLPANYLEGQSTEISRPNNSNIVNYEKNLKDTTISSSLTNKVTRQIITIKYETQYK